MSVELTILTGLIGGLALLAIIRPSMLFAYPIAAAMLMWFFLIPQAWRIESVGELNDFEPTITWVYMTLCVVMTVIGFVAGNARTPVTNRNTLAALSEKYDLNKLFIGSVALVIIGGGAMILTAREAATMAANEAWTGAIAFYAMISILLIYGSCLSWLLYLYTSNLKSLAVAIFGLSLTIPTILFGARRELSFTVASIFLLGLFFVKGKSLSRLILVPMVLFGGILVNQAGDIRGYIAKKDSNLIEAVADGNQKSSGTNLKRYDEMASGVSDIAIASWTNDYKLLTPYYNTIVQLYVPAFILGRDFKNAIRIDDSDSELYKPYFANGATRTGFSDSFQSFHYFGCLIFLMISYAMGILWKNAKSGDIVSQFYYMLLLAVGLKVFTESTSIFVGILPLIIGSTYVVFRYARRKVPTLGGQPLAAATRQRLS